MNRRAILASGIVAAVLTMAVTSMTAAAAPDTDFFVHDADTETEPVVGGTITVCTFHLHAIPTGSDDHETGNWEILAADGSVAQSGLYETIGLEGDRIPDTGTMSLAPGSYRLRWDSEAIDASFWAKDFAVVCRGGGVAPTASVLPTTGVNPNPGDGAVEVTLPPTDSQVPGPRPSVSDGGTWMVVIALGILSAAAFAATSVRAGRVRARRR